MTKVQPKPKASITGKSKCCNAEVIRWFGNLTPVMLGAPMPEGKINCMKCRKDSKKEAEQQMEFQRELHEAKCEVSKKFWGKDSSQISFPKCQVVEIKIPNELIEL